MRHLLRATAVAGLLVCPAVFLPALSANASVGIGIQADPVRLAGNAHPGGTFTLPDVYVVNTGSQAESISVSVQRMNAAKSGLNVPGSWIQASSVPAQLAPGQAVRIPLRLVTPGDARLGRYASDIVVTGTVQPDAGSPVRFSAAAATGLEFSLVASAPGGYPLWKVWLVVAVLLGAAVTIFGRHTGLRIRIERSNGGARA
ncbi:MAG TPA: hypothetical protein VKU39_00720 [Streptosporangiaceae bacterium]|nr:hypothetical protein [Streptosporangiaceae bacterium]